MKVKELLEHLNKCDPEADVFYGSERKHSSDEPAFELFDFAVEVYRNGCWSYGNASPKHSFQKNAVVLVYD